MAKMVCAECGAEKSCECTAGYIPLAEYLPKVISENPGVSSAVIAVKHGLSARTVRYYQASGRQNCQPERKGKDGKIYIVKKKSSAPAGSARVSTQRSGGRKVKVPPKTLSLPAQLNHLTRQLEGFRKAWVNTAWALYEEHRDNEECCARLVQSASSNADALARLAIALDPKCRKLELVKGEAA